MELDAEGAEIHTISLDTGVPSTSKVIEGNDADSTMAIDGLPNGSRAPTSSHSPVNSRPPSPDFPS